MKAFPFGAGVWALALVGIAMIPCACALMPPPAKSLDYLVSIETGKSADQCYELSMGWIRQFLRQYSKAKVLGDNTAHTISTKLKLRLQVPSGGYKDIGYSMHIEAQDGRTQFLFHIVDDILTSYSSTTLGMPFFPTLLETRMIVTQADYDAYASHMDLLVADYREYLSLHR